jgi:hypothetical protein
MRLLLRNVPRSVLRASAEGWSVGLAVSASHLIVARAGWFRGGHIERIPLRRIEDIELHARVKVSRLHIKVADRHLVYLYDSGRERDFEHLVACARQIAHGTARPRFVSRIVLQGGHLKVCGRTR